MARRTKAEEQLRYERSIEEYLRSIRPKALSVLEISEATGIPAGDVMRAAAYLNDHGGLCRNGGRYYCP